MGIEKVGNGYGETASHHMLPVLGVFLFSKVDPNGGDDASGDRNIVAISGSGSGRRVERGERSRSATDSEIANKGKETQRQRCR